MRIACLVLLAASGSASAQPKVVLVVHGGAGAMSEAEMKAEGLSRQDFERDLALALQAGYDAMKPDRKTSVDGVEAAIRVLEDSALFNAGRGAVFTRDGRVELDASIMDGRVTGRVDAGKKDPRKRAGAVSGVTHVKNPISAARAVMEMEGARPVLLVGAGAEDVVLAEDVRKLYFIDKVSNVYFWTPRRLREIQEEVGGKKVTARAAWRNFGTVGAVAVRDGRVAAGTSTGGLTGKLPGRVGDSPIIGAGTYADDRACGVSCTGTGEVFIRHAVAHDIVARMLYGNKSVVEAAGETMKELPDDDDGIGGLIALDNAGRPAFEISPKCAGMYRGQIDEKGEILVAIYAGEELKRVAK